MSSRTLLHWHCEQTTYSVQRLTADKAILLITKPGGTSRRGRRHLPIATVVEWARLPILERCERAQREL